MPIHPPKASLGVSQLAQRPSKSSAANLCDHSQYFAEPLWFALFCTETWGANAPKELRFHLHDRWSDRTYWGWAHGDNEPAPRAIMFLLCSQVGHLLIEFAMRFDPPKWWVDVTEDRRQAAILRGAMREAAGSP